MVPPMVITSFRSRSRPGHVEEYGRPATKMHSLAERMAGFISITTFTAEDGERVSIVEFESEETLLARRNQSDHQQAQVEGRRWFYSHYRNPVCHPVGDYSFAKKTDETRNSV